jgi:Mg/Co/Ni transporter MgtE
MAKKDAVLKVSEVMVALERYPHVLSTTTLREAIALIRRGMEKVELSGFRQALVLDERQALSGMITVHALLRGLEPKTLLAAPHELAPGYAAAASPTDVALEVFWDKVFASGFHHDEPDKPVGAIAAPVPAVVAPGDSVSRALSLMLARHAAVLPVVEEGKVVGVVRIWELFDRVAKIIRKGKKS